MRLSEDVHAIIHDHLAWVGARASAGVSPTVDELWLVRLWAAAGDDIAMS